MYVYLLNFNITFNKQAITQKTFMINRLPHLGTHV